MIDTNGDGKITKPWNEPVAGARPAEHARPRGSSIRSSTRGSSSGPYGIIVNPVDKAIWGATDEVACPGRSSVSSAGQSAATCMTERYMLPKELGYRPRGIDIDRNGVDLDGAGGQRAAGELRSAEVQGSNGPATRDGRHCDEGWTFYKQPGPSFKGTDDRLGVQLLQLGRPVQHARPWRERADRERLGLRLAARVPAGNEGVGR